MAGMGVGEIAALALAAGGTYASMSATQQQEKKQQRKLNQQLENTEKATDKSVDLIQTAADQYSPEARAASMAAAEGEAATRAQQDLEGAGGATLATAGDAGNVSTDFLTAKADRAISEGTRMTALSRELAKIRAPGQVLQQEGYKQGNLASALQNIQGSNANMARANSMDASSIEAPGYGQLGSIATALGGAYMGSKPRAGTGSQIAWNTPATSWAFGNSGMGS